MITDIFVLLPAIMFIVAFQDRSSVMFQPFLLSGL